LRQRTEHVLPHTRVLARVTKKKCSRCTCLRGACRNRHYSSLPCRRVEGTSAANGATGHRRNSAASSPSPGATGCWRATARTSAGWITSATSGTLTTLTRSSSAVAVSSRGGGVSSPSVRWRKLGDGRGRLCCAAPAPCDTRATSASSVTGSISLDGSSHWLQALGERSLTLSGSLQPVVLCWKRPASPHRAGLQSGSRGRRARARGESRGATTCAELLGSEAE